MFRRNKQPPPPAAPPSPPRLDDGSARQLEQLIDAFLNAQSLGETQGPIERLLELASLRIAPLETSDRSIWTWFSAITPQASARTRVQIGLFTDEFHDSYAVQAPMAAATLGSAPDALRDELLGSALKACSELDPEQTVLPRIKVPVHNLQASWSKQLGRPVESIATPEPSGETVEKILVDAEGGDEAKQALVAGSVALGEGRHEEALRYFEHGAKLGSVDAMLGAAQVAVELSKPTVNHFWNEQAAAAGDTRGMFNLGIAAFDTNDLATANRWFQSAAQAGNSEAYAALIEVAERSGDDVAARRWAETGAQMNNPRCLEVHAMNILRGREQEPAVFREALGLMERAANQGYAAAMDRCGVFHLHSGNPTQAKYWWQEAVKAGDPDAQERLVRHGLA
jgi:hypothetical protein